MIYYFAYGSNLDQGQMNKRCPDSKLVGRAVLKDYALDFMIYSTKRKCGCADIIKNEKGEVWGLIYSLSEKDLKALDRYEGCPNYYKRIEIKVINDSGVEIKAYAYEVVDKKSFTKPSKEYLDIIKNAAKKYNFPKNYREMIETIEHI